MNRKLLFSHIFLATSDNCLFEVLDITVSRLLWLSHYSCFAFRYSIYLLVHSLWPCIKPQGIWKEENSSLCLKVSGHYTHTHTHTQNLHT